MSMFSQSLLLGEDTFSELERDHQPGRPPESMEIIEESPTNVTSNRTRSRTSARATQKNRTKRSTNPTPASRVNIPQAAIVADNLSAFFHSDLDDCPEFKESIAIVANSKPTQSGPKQDSTLDQFFGESIDFNQTAATSVRQAITRAEARTLATDYQQGDNELLTGDMFAKSDFFSQLNTDGSSCEPQHERPINTADLGEISFDNTSFRDQPAANLHETHVPVVTNVPSSELLWEDSNVFDNTFSSEPIAIVEDAVEEVAADIDNVTFTQDFLRPRLSQNPKAIAGKNGTGDGAATSDKTVNQFIQREMDKCKRIVSRGLANDVQAGMNDSLFNSSNTSNIVLNYSADSAPRTEDRSVRKHVKTAAAVALPETTEADLVRVMPSQNLNQIDQWGLSKAIVDQYHRKGIRTMFDWQVECLSNTKVLFDGANLVYSAPTSAGKTLVSELLMIKNVLEQRRKSLFILPFISVVREKMFYLQELLSPAGLTVEGFFGGYTPPCGFDATNIAVCTIEKANSIVNRLLEQQRIEQIGCIVVDEIHLISDPSRGYILELLLAKILYACRRFSHRIQIVTMSATLPNLELLTKWLAAEFYRTDYRPVALQEMIKIDSVIYDQSMKPLRQLDTTPFVPIAKDQDGIGQLCVETLAEGCAVIVFCPSKDWCESLSTHVAGFVYAVGKSKSDIGLRLRACLDMEAIEELKAQLRNSSTGLDPVLERAVSYGCAFHHAGLTTDERDIVESAFKAGTLKVIVATSTLSSGVNLPARRVIIRTPMFGGKVMNSLTYKQMIGRAGRTGRDTVGESILVCGAANSGSGKQLVCATLPPLQSCLDADGHVHLKRAILEIIASGMASSIGDLEQFTNSTLLASEKEVRFACVVTDSLRVQRDTERSTSSSRRRADTSAVENADAADDVAALDPIAACLKFLLKYEFVRLLADDATGDTHFVATRLGMACLASSMPPGDGFLLFSELQKSRQNFVLESELHAVYLVTPFSVCYQMQSIDWLAFLDMWEKLPAAMRRVGEMVGVRESFLVKAMRSHKLDFKALQVHKRFYTALALQELVNETNVNVVAAKYKCSRGMLQSLQQMASTFAGVVEAFCTALNWNLLALIIAQFKERLFFGVHRDLIDLMKMPNLNGQRARCIFDAGLKTLADLANADGRALERILYDSISFDAKQREGETDYEAARRNKVRCLYVTGKAGLTVGEAARNLIEDARRYLEQEMGLQNVQWNVVKTEEDIANDPIKLTPDLPITTESATSEAPKLSQDLPVILPKRKSTEPLESPVEFKQPNGEPRRSGTRKSPRIEQQQQSRDVHKTPVRQSSNTYPSLKPTAQITPPPIASTVSEIIVTPLQTQKNRTRTQFEHMKTGGRTNPATARKKLLVPKPVENPMQNQIIDADSIDSIRFSRSHNGSSTLTSSASILNCSHILSVSKSSETATGDDATTNLAQLDIINVCGNSTLFQQFVSEVSTATELSLALAISHNLPSSRRSTVIGGNLLMRADATQGASNDSVMRANRRCIFEEDMLYVNGVAVCLGDTGTCFFVDMQDKGAGAAVPFADKSRLLESLCGREDVTLRVYDAKEQCKALRKAVPGIREICGRLEDPRIANWLLQPDVDSGLKDMAQKYAPECVGLCDLGGTAPANGALGLHYMSEVLPRLRAAVECAAIGPILRGQKENLQRLGTGDILKSFAEMEMPIQHSLISMEIAGMSIDADQLEQLATLMENLMKRLEREMFKVHGRRFNVASTVEVAKVLGMRGGRGKVSTAKAVLQKMTADPMSGWVMQWRTLSAALNKTMRPLQQAMYRGRIHGSSCSLTQTGRISMHEPNVQNVAKDFVVFLDSNEYPVSCRSCFRCPPQRALLSADFCQLELRILSHLSIDPLMVQVMQSTSDVFTTISATWNSVPESQVTEEQRNRTKQICYGIIYGMGARAMADTLQCDEDTARSLTESFHHTYPGIRTYTERIVSYARQQGYVETLAGRRRYLPAIQADNGTQRAQAERQAVNTTIQGSAADVAKYAMLRMERNVRKYANTLRINVAGVPESRVELVLHLHDELVYEVPVDRVKSVAKVLRSSMENCAKLNVPLRVKLKAGRSWGEMEKLDV